MGSIEKVLKSVCAVFCCISICMCVYCIQCVVYPACVTASVRILRIVYHCVYSEFVINTILPDVIT